MGKKKIKSASMQNVHNISIPDEIILRERKIGKLCLLIYIIKEEQEKIISSMRRSDIVEWTGFSEEEIDSLCLWCGEFREPNFYLASEVWEKMKISKDRACVLTGKSIWNYGNSFISYFIMGIQEGKITENNCLEYLNKFKISFFGKFQKIIKKVSDKFDKEDSTMEYTDMDACVICLITYGKVVIEKIEQMIEIEYPFEIVNQITSFDFTEETYDKFKKIMEKFDVTKGRSV